MRNWITRFVKRNSLHSIFNLSPDSQIAFNNDPDVITDLFAFYRTSSREIWTILMKWGVLFGNSRVILTSQRLSDSSHSKIRAWKGALCRFAHPALSPHSTHHLQSYDVGLFQPLQAIYGRQVDNHYRMGHTGVNKEFFLKLYDEARKIAFTKESILAAWRGTGLAHNPTAVLKRLHTYIGESRSRKAHRFIVCDRVRSRGSEDARNSTRDRGVVCRHPKLPYGAFRWVARVPRQMQA